MERVSVIDVSKKFSDNSLFCEVNFSFSAGEIIGISGNNGSGKTTFIKLLCGLIYPDSGTVNINGIEVKKNRTKCMKDIGVLLEGSRSLYWRLSAIQNFIYFTGLKGIFGREALIKAKKALQLFDLWNVRDNKVETFSFGMKQRLSLACSTAHSPSVILLDEPTSGLDSISAEMLEEYILLLADQNKTIILASHDHKMIERISTRRLTIDKGIISDIF